MPVIKSDEFYIKQCFALAKKGIGNVSPNPLVGCVIVKKGKIVSKGYHKKFGQAHAEANAIVNAKQNLSGSTLYCNLEPCCHTNKKTAPCVPAIIAAGIKRVVISNVDPNPNVAGKGIEQLREAGIEVAVDICKEEGEELNKFFFKAMKKKSSYITLKIAQSLDGKITYKKGKQTWLTGEESQKFVHTQRALYDAVLVGAGTINIDNPQLNVRAVNGRNPQVIILDGKLSVNPNSKIFHQKNRMGIWVFTSKNSSKLKMDRLLALGVKVIQLKADKNAHIKVKEICKTLFQQNINSIFVEGGREVFSQFLEENLFDELILLKSPKILGTGLDAFSVNRKIELNLYSSVKLGKDVKLTYKNN